MKKTKMALFQSVVALLLCFSMLVGTTFAWFTDEVTAGMNQIIAGNLDVELLADGQPVTSTTKLFELAPPNLWEPGMVVYENLTVLNAGTLALKWQMGLNFGNENHLDGHKLSDVLQIAIIDTVAQGTSRDQVLAAAKASDTKGALSSFYKSGELLANASESFAVVIFWEPGENDNNYNANNGKQTSDGQPLHIEFGVRLQATQLANESDSFGSDYDADVNFPALKPGSMVIDLAGKVENGAVTELMVASDEENRYAAQILPGTKVTGDKLVLSVSELSATGSNVQLQENEVLRSLDVHIDGVAADNTVPVVITVEEAMMPGLNVGNYALYHVENGETKTMTAGNLADHNGFVYDPVTGDVTLAMASFSEVAVVAEPAKWEGGFDYSWYDANASEFTIANADQLAAFGAIVGGMKKVTGIEDGKYTYADEVIQDSFAGDIVKLIADINLGDDENNNIAGKIFYPIGYWNDEGTYEKTGTAISSGFYTFQGTFDGNGHTISNFYQNTWEMKGDHNWYAPEDQYYRDGMGLFGRVYGGTIKNLTVKNFSSDGEITTTGVIAAYADCGATFENIAVTNCNPRVYNIGNGGIVGCVGWYSKTGVTADSSEEEIEKLKVKFTNITVDNSNKISALWGSYDVACGGIVGQYYPTSGQSSANYPKNAGIEFKNCHISAQMDVYNDVCANYQYYAYRYTGMLIGSVRENVTIDGHTYPKMDGITAKNCTVHFGTWNDYYYCEIIDNTTASYTHDYQMSRLTEIKAIDGTTITYLDGTTGTVPASGRANYVIVDYSKGHGTENATCYHFKDGKVWNHEDGGKEIVNGVEVLKEDKQHIYLEFNNLVTGYGWGVTSRGFANLDGVTNLDITLGDQESSVVKFEDAGYDPKDYRAGETIFIGNLFKAKDNVTINKDSVYVSVSSITNDDKVSAIFNLNEDDWTKSTITFASDCNGTAKITITDYIFCTPTTIYLNEESAAVKFVDNKILAQNAYTKLAFGTIFGVKNGSTIGNVTATVTDPNGNKTTVTGTSSDWATKTIDLVKEGTWKVSIVDDDKYCAATEITFNVNKVDKFTKKFDKDFLYRVGNQNAVNIGTIFSEIETAAVLSSVNVQITNIAGNAAGTFTSKTSWTSGTIQFTGTGVVKVTISADGANPVELCLEVIDATNSTSAIGTTTGGNFVLLCDVNTSDYQYLWDCKIYGNGFTYSLKGAPKKYSSGHGHGVLIANNATLDNLVIVGDEYSGYGAFTSNDFYTSAIDVTGDTIIQNCYISGCSAPVRARSNVTIINSTLYGGSVANLIIMGGTVTLEDVTTANYDDGRELVGMGIVIHSDATESAKLVLDGTLIQYNFMSESKVPTDTYAKNLHNAMFSSDCSQYQFGTSPNRYVNTGIISLTSIFNGEDITDNAKTGYAGKSLRVSSYDGYVYTQPNTSGSVNNNCPEYKPTTQGAVPPSYSFDYTNKNYVAKTDGSNDYCYQENGKVNISMDQGDTFNWDTSILTIGKGVANYTVSMNGTDYTGKSIAFNTAGDYTVTYTYTDDNNYKLDVNGNITTYSVTYTKTVNITVAVVKATTKHAEFTFGSSNMASTTVTVGNNTYVMPNFSGTSDPIGSTTVNGQTIYYPIVEMIMSDGKTSHSRKAWYAYFPVFSGAVTITDYANNGTGDKMTPYDSSTTTMPSGLSVVGDPTQLFKYQSGSAAGSTPVVKNNILVYSSPSISADRNEYNTVIQYSYTDNAGATYYYYIGYHAAKQTYGTCVTPDTLVTLADGTQKRIDQVTYEDQILVWNFYTGAYDVANAMALVNHGYEDNEIIKLVFSDGSVLKFIAVHGVFSKDHNQFVDITADNCNDYIGTIFLKSTENGFTDVTLVDCEVYTEYTESWTIVTEKHYNAILNSLFTANPSVCEAFPGADVPQLEPYEAFELGDNMRYDLEKMQADIDKYGLYEYEEFKDYISYEKFVAWDIATLKVVVGKGYATYESVLNYINIINLFTP